VWARRRVLGRLLADQDRAEARAAALLADGDVPVSRAPSQYDPDDIDTSLCPGNIRAGVETLGDTEPQSYTAFDGHTRLAHGRLDEVVVEVKRRRTASSSILIFSDTTGKVMDFDLRGSERDILERLQVFRSRKGGDGGAPAAPIGPGRPRLGVVAREVSLLPRHWEWLAVQSGGASATLRRLVEEARTRSSGTPRIREAQERAHRFLTGLAGDLPRYEEALRALYARDERRFKDQLSGWPDDVRKYALELAAPALRARKEGRH